MKLDISSERLFVLIMLIFIPGIATVRHVSLTIPTAARARETVTLQCKYDLVGEPLYTLKWYKGSKEIYRFIPKELPNILIFPLPGMNIDKSKSSMNDLVLTNVQPEMTGKYKCEVSSDAPNFYTLMQSAYMYVVDVPQEEPIMFLEKDSTEIGQVLKANCTAPASYPPANITWFLNGKKINESARRTLPGNIQTKTNAKRTPQITSSEIEVEIDEKSFYSGKATFTCSVNIFNLYQRQTEKTVEEERPRPRPSSVLGNRDTSRGNVS